MCDGLRIKFDPLTCETGDELDRAFAASITIEVGEEYLTRIDDLGANTVRNNIRASSWQLATWLATNWWRLRWEPVPNDWQRDTDWRMAHCLAATGGGYVWPNAIFASDGDTIEIVSKPKPKSARFEPIRYINHIRAHTSASDFERTIDGFIEGVLSRMHALKLKNNSLSTLWAEILEERSNPQATQHRKLEAMAGFDPDQAPDELIADLLNDKEKLGKTALTEVAAEARKSIGEALKQIRVLGHSRKPKAGGFRTRIPHLTAPFKSHNDEQPWQNAARLARIVRSEWGFGNKPIRNHILADLLGAKTAMFSDTATASTPIPVGIRAGNSDAIDFYFDRSGPTTRRFTTSRLLGDYLYFDKNERLLPATHAKTARQKFQRAFAQEFLCPIDALLEKIDTTQPDEDDISEAAHYFHVSPLMVRTTLVNHNELQREALTWAD